ncbi:MAG: hypothetical protein V3V78_05010 [Candidatus Woesearchaeota archaeon]
MGIFDRFKKKKPVLEETQIIENPTGNGNGLVTLINEYWDHIKDRTLNFDYDETYGRREQDGQFLEVFVNYIDQTGYQHQEFKSTQNINVTTDEAREVLQPTLYDDFISYTENAGFLSQENFQLTWDTARNAVGSILKFARSLKKSYDFFLDVCQDEKSKLTKYPYGVLPAGVGNEDIRKITILIENKELGPNIDYENVTKFIDQRKNLNISANPEISKAYEFFDMHMQTLVYRLKNLSDRFPTAFKLYKFTSSEGYKGIESVRRALDTSDEDKKGTATFYYPELVERRIVTPKSGATIEDFRKSKDATKADIEYKYGKRVLAYKQAMDDANMNVAEIPEYLISLNDINEMISEMEAIQKQSQRKGIVKREQVQERMEEGTKWVMNPFNIDKPDKK